jgi:hypothetical protein
MLTLITTALAVFTVLMAVRAVLPFALPARLMPVLVVAAAHEVGQLPASFHPYVQAAAVAGLVAVIHRFAVAQDPEPWSLRELAERVALAFPGKPKTRARVAGVGNRIPPL